MSRFFVLSLFALALPAFAQPSEDYSGLEDYIQPKQNSFSFALRFSGKAKVRFSNLGTIDTARVAGGLTAEENRTYDDGFVGIDARTTTDGTDLPDDHRTNTWQYNHRSQVTPDESGIAFHTYSTESDGASVTAESGASAGMDLEYSRQYGETEHGPEQRVARFAWGASLGFGLNSVNVKDRSTIKATLKTLTDTYSLLGAAVPYDGDDSDGVAYSAPSSATQTGTAADGSSTSLLVDTTTLLGNRPESRVLTEQVGGATIDGFWQVRGAYFTVRAGPWVRWQPNEKLSLRMAVGGTVSWLGLRMRYDERLKIDDSGTEIQAAEEAENASFAIPGGFGSVDAEWWLTQRTAFFGGATYEKFSKEVDISAGGRNAHIEISSGLGLRFGITTRF